MTTKWMIKVYGDSKHFKVYGPYGQKRAESLAMKLSEHVADQGLTVVASPMWDPGINELRSQYQ